MTLGKTDLKMVNLKKDDLKTCITYYGGKQQLLPKILPLIPVHIVYSEPFFGGGAVFFAKEPAKVEIINDINKMVVNFYKVAKRNFKQLKAEIDTTLYSEQQYREAREIYFNSTEVKQKDVLRAWALYVLSHQTFLHILDNTWRFSRDRNMGKYFTNKKDAFNERYIKRLENTQIFCRDAINVIKNADTPDTFHFIDPPYFNSNMGHYRGYTEEDFEQLLERMETVSGKFLMTTYPSEILAKYVKKNKWYQIEFEMPKSASSKKGVTKIEVFTMNYFPSDEMLSHLVKK